VAGEFDRVARAFRAVADKQAETERAETQATIAILEAKRAEILAIDRAGYYIEAWQELSGKVREAIASDPQYRAIKAGREERRRKQNL
jgi:hypothetical protein